MHLAPFAPLTYTSIASRCEKYDLLRAFFSNEFDERSSEFNMILGLMLIVAGTAGLSATLGWIAHDIIQTKGLYKNFVSHRKNRGHVIPPTTEMYEGIRIVDR